MMRIHSVLLCALVAAACSFGGSGNGGGGGVDAAVAARCGDGVCAATEVNSCPADCGTGGHGSGSGSGSGSNPGGAVCGNDICEAGETAQTCPSDCAQMGSGSNMGSGALDCNDENVLIECLECEAMISCTGVDLPDCEVCLGS